MAKEVVVTRRGQTTIPMEIRRKLAIKEGSRLRAEAEGDKSSLAGTSKQIKEEALKLLKKMREKTDHVAGLLNRKINLSCLGFSWNASF